MPYENDARDYYDIIDWVSKQSWCDGQVATTGGSYLGFAQWQAVRKQFKHPALKAINPMVSVGFGIDFPRWSHQFYSYILRWQLISAVKN
jgi:putative CocE/NonD family hydrolase